MAARVTQHVVELIVARPTYSPASVTGAGVTQHVAELVLQATANARVTQHAVELIISGTPDGSHGDPGGGTATPATTTFGYAV